MSITIGRIGIDFAVDGVLKWDHDGERVSVRLEVYSSLADALVVRQQALGLVNSPDESFVPVTWAEEPQVDGYYRVLSASVSPHSDGANIFYVDLDMERVQGYAAPLIELTTVGATRTNTHSFANPRQFVAVSSFARSTVFVDPDSNYVGLLSSFGRDSADGSLVTWRMTPSPLYVTQFYIDPAAHYYGAATLLMGSPLRTIVGRQVPNDADGWQISNGLFQMEAVAGSTFDMRFRAYHDGAWSAWISCSIMSGVLAASRAVLSPPHAITVLRNGPEEVAIRLHVRNGAANSNPITVDLSLKRGSRYVAMEFANITASAVAVRCASFNGATATSPYLSKTISTERMVMVGPQVIGITSNDVYPNQGGVTEVKNWSVAIGLVEAADATDTVVAAVEEYMFAGTAKQSVVAL